jgi:hypothetical protein
MKRILREKQQPRIKNIREQVQIAQRLQEDVAQVQQQFNELMEQMAMAEIALAQLEAGADHVDVKIWPYKRDYDEE